MDYRKIFDATDSAPLEHVMPNPDELGIAADEGAEYVLDDEIELAVNVALATGRALLVRGEPGSGKSSLAAGLAHRLRWRFYQRVVTSRTEAEDLLWRFDAVRRLADASDGPLQSNLAEYVQPGVLWWAIAPESAERRGTPKDSEQELEPAKDPVSLEFGGNEPGVVVLIDEIDKAPPDLPNDLLEVLGARRFVVRETEAQVTASRVPLLIISTNEERSLPDAFLRRCVVLELKAPDLERLKSIGRAHFGSSIDPELLKLAANEILEQRELALQQRLRAPSTAEYLDLLRACNELGIGSGEHELWQALSRAVLWKHGAEDQVHT